MATIKTTLSIRATRDVLADFAQTLHHARKGIAQKPRNEISFESIDTLRKVLTKGRMELLSAIKRKKPSSVYALSKLLHRDLKSVNTDLNILEENDLISLRKVKDGRERVVPVVNFDSLTIDVEI